MYLSRLTREVVSRLESSSDTLLDSGVSAVVGGEDGVLEATGVEELDVELAVLAVLGNGDTRADGGNVGIEDQGDDAAVIRDLGGHGALRTSSSAIADLVDLDLYMCSEVIANFHRQENLRCRLGEQYRGRGETGPGRQQRLGGERGATSY